MILLTAFDNPDVSRLAPAAVRDYLNSMMVPLVTWQLTPPRGDESRKETSWGPIFDVTDWGGLGIALRELRELLNSQFLVWVEGRHLQREITVSSEAPGIRLAQRSSTELDAELRRLAAADALLRPAEDTGRTASTEGGRELTLIDSDRLERARRLLSPEQTEIPLGPGLLVTDTATPALWSELERISLQVPELYAMHYQLSLDLESGAATVLFANEATYRAYEAEVGISSGELAGHASPGLVTLFSGDRSRQEIADTFTHELVHLLTLRSLGSAVPPWLDEGLAESMTFASRTRRGSLALGPLDPRRLRAASPAALRGPLALIGRLAGEASGDDLPTLEELTELQRQAFMGGDGSDVLYALSALWVHYLGTVDPKTGPGFRSYLQILTDPTSQPAGLFEVVSANPADLERDFRGWLEWLAGELLGAGS